MLRSLYVYKCVVSSTFRKDKYGIPASVLNKLCFKSTLDRTGSQNNEKWVDLESKQVC